MLLCDKCNRGYHTSCLSPPMEAIPEGEWFCQRCDSRRAQLKGKGSVPTARKAAAPRALMTDSDSDEDDFQAPPSRPAGRLTARQGTLAGVPFCCIAPSNCSTWLKKGYALFDDFFGLHVSCVKELGMQILSSFWYEAFMWQSANQHEHVLMCW